MLFSIFSTTSPPRDGLASYYYVLFRSYVQRDPCLGTIVATDLTIYSTFRRCVKFSSSPCISLVRFRNLYDNEPDPDFRCLQGNFARTMTLNLSPISVALYLSSMDHCKSLQVFQSLAALNFVVLNTPQVVQLLPCLAWYVGSHVPGIRQRH